MPAVQVDADGGGEMKHRKLHRRYGRASSHKTFTHIGHGYRVTDGYASQLARAEGKSLSLLKHGYAMAIIFPGGIKAWLSRTPVTTNAYGFTPPPRGWVWYVYPNDSTGLAFFDYVKGVS